MERRRIETSHESPADIVRNQLKERVIGQDDAIDAIGGALDKARLRDDRRPVANIMLLGPTGSGKTETAQALADIMAIDKLHPNFLRIDCAQFAQGHEVAALVGAPPGYVGHSQKPILDKELIEQPGSVVLFDEIEKGHPKLWNYLLQIMEGDGVKLLNEDKTINFNNTIVLMTSNVGAREMEAMMTDKKIGFASPDLSKPQKMENVAMTALKKQFAPEFVNRLDAAVTYKPLDDGQLSEVLQAHINRANLRYERKGNFKLEASDRLKQAIVESSEDRREYNARPVLRNYERMVETELSRQVSSLTIGGKYVEADYEDGVVTFYEGKPLPDVAELLMLEAIIDLPEPEVAGDDEPDCEDDEPKVVEFKPRPKKRRRR